MKIKEYLVEAFDGENINNHGLRHPRFWHYVKIFTIVEIITVLLMSAYIEIGHDKGWKRADVWYTCTHTHHHFPWQ